LPQMRGFWALDRAVREEAARSVSGGDSDHRPGDPSKCEPVPPGVVCENHERPPRERPVPLSRREPPGNSPGIRIRRHSSGRRPAGPLGRIPRSGPCGAEMNPASLDGASSEEGCWAGGNPPEGDSSPVDGRASRRERTWRGRRLLAQSVGPPAWRRPPRCPRCRKRGPPESLEIGLWPFPWCVRGSKSSAPDAYPGARDIASFPGELGVLSRSCLWGGRVHPGW